MARMAATLKQGWWAPLAALLVLSNTGTGLLILLNEQNPGSLVGGSFFLAGAIAIAAGLLVREQKRGVGSLLILFGAFWGLPIFWLILPPLLAIAVWFGVIRSGVSAGRREATATS